MLAITAYPTYTLFLSFATATILVLIAMPLFIKFLKRDGIGQQVRADGPASHLIKQGTPTMGGIIILLAAIVSIFFFTQPTKELWITLAVLVATGLLGLLDDIESVSHGRSLGLSGKAKMTGLGVIAVVFCLCVVNLTPAEPVVLFPGGLSVNLGVLSTTIPGTTISIPWLYLAFVFFLLAGLANAVNLTDGLDGLSSGCVMVVMTFLAMVCFQYNNLSLAVVCASIAGACVGFLWYNSYPAQVFMGDTGSLALGGVFAAIAVLTKTEITSLVMGGLFIVEALSVMVQVASFKLTGKRIFLMAPIHHHFEKKGWSETKVVIRFWIISGAFAALGFSLFFTLP